MLILMGENQVKSREALNRLKEEAREKKKEVIALNGKSVKLAELKQALEAESLFGGEKLVVIEELFARRESQDKKELIQYLKDNQGNWILWEGKKLDKRKLKGFGAKIKEFEVASVIFKLMDSLAPGNTEQMIEYLEKCLKQEPPEMIFYMMARQVRLMLQASQAAEEFKGPKWLKGKMRRQADKFGEQELLEVHDKLYQIDKNIKTGQSPIDLESQLEMLLISL